MLIQLKNKQHKIASVTLSIFVGGWLLLLCQTCFAAINEIRENNQPVAEMTNSCHAPLSVDEDIKVSEEHDCLGVCDCDVINVIINSEKNSDLIEKIKFSPDLYAYIVPQITLSNRAPPTYRISSTPERAILLPLQRYTVLLI